MTPYMGSILPFAGTYAPQDWHFCDGTLLSVSQYEALFSLFGTTYGGDGVNTFGIPDLRARMPVGAYMNVSNGDIYPLGSKGGQAYTTLTSANMPLHSHTAPPITTQASGTYKISNATATTTSPTAGSLLAAGPVTTSTTAPYTTTPATIPLASSMANFTVPVGTAGFGATQTVPSVPPYVGVSFIVALVGLYPVRP